MRTLSPLLGMLRLRNAFDIGKDGHVVLKPVRLPELPHALLVPRWRILPDADRVLEALGDPAFDPRHVVLLERDPGLQPGSSDDAGRVAVRDVSTEEIEITADVTEPAVLLVTDNYSALWTVTPLEPGDTRTYRVDPGNYVQRAIPLSPGHHHLRLAYRPSALPVGAGVTLLTMVGCAAILVRGRAPRAPSRMRPPPPRSAPIATRSNATTRP